MNVLWQLGPVRSVFRKIQTSPQSQLRSLHIYILKPGAWFNAAAGPSQSPTKFTDDPVKASRRAAFLRLLHAQDPGGYTRLSGGVCADTRQENVQLPAPGVRVLAPRSRDRTLKSGTTRHQSEEYLDEAFSSTSSLFLLLSLLLLVLQCQTSPALSPWAFTSL